MGMLHACGWTSVVGIIIMLERYELESFKLKSFLIRKDRVEPKKSYSVGEVPV